MKTKTVLVGVALAAFVMGSMIGYFYALYKNKFIDVNSSSNAKIAPPVVGEQIVSVEDFNKESFSREPEPEPEGMVSEPSIEIEAFNKVNNVFHVKYVLVKVRSVDDNVTVEDVVVNRGNCKIENINVFNKKRILPKKLKFGESVSVTFSGPCEVAQVDVITNDGSWTVSY